MRRAKEGVLSCRASRVVLVGLMPILVGCAGVPAAALLPGLMKLAHGKEEVASFVAEDGSRYVNLTTGRFSSPPQLRAKWRRIAEKSCDGDYEVIAEDASERRTAGIVTGRTHEGYVRCVLEPEYESSMAAPSKGPRAQ